MREEIEKYVGKTGTIVLNGLTIRVKIQDVKNSYGRDRYLITPIEGAGVVWVESVSLE